MNKLIGVVAFAGILVVQSLFIATGSAGEDSSQVVMATIGKQKVTAGDIDARIARMPFEMKAGSLTEEEKMQLLKEMVQIEVFSREARSQGLHKDKDLQARIEEMTKAILATAMVKQALAKVVVSEAEAQTYYHDHLVEFTTPEAVKAAFLLIHVPLTATPDVKEEKEKKARTILKRLKRGEEFTKLADALSDSPAKSTPELFPRGRLSPEIEAVLFDLKPGDITDVMEVPEGFLIFKIEGREPERVQSFDEVRERIRKKLQAEKERQAFTSLEKSLFAKYRVTIHDQEKRAGVVAAGGGTIKQ